MNLQISNLVRLYANTKGELRWHYHEVSSPPALTNLSMEAADHDAVFLYYSPRKIIHRPNTWCRCIGILNRHLVWVYFVVPPGLRAPLTSSDARLLGVASAVVLYKRPRQIFEKPGMAVMAATGAYISSKAVWEDLGKIWWGLWNRRRRCTALARWAGAWEKITWTLLFQLLAASPRTA